MAKGTPGNWSDFLGEMDHVDPQDVISLVSPASRSFINPQGGVQTDLSAAQTDEDDPNNGVDYSGDSSGENGTSESCGPSLESQSVVTRHEVMQAALSEAARAKQERGTQRSELELAEPVQERKAALNHSDILRLTTNKHYNL
jgi:hypothetical protein